MNSQAPHYFCSTSPPLASCSLERTSKVLSTRQVKCCSKWWGPSEATPLGRPRELRCHGPEPYGCWRSWRRGRREPPLQDVRNPVSHACSSPSPDSSQPRKQPKRKTEVKFILGKTKTKAKFHPPPQSRKVSSGGLAPPNGHLSGLTPYFHQRSLRCCYLGEGLLQVLHQGLGLREGREISATLPLHGLP